MSIKARRPVFKRVTKDGLTLVRVEPIVVKVDPFHRKSTPVKGHARRVVGSFKLWYWGPRGYVTKVSTVKSRKARFKDNVRWWV